MFSSRVHWDLRPNRISALLAAKRAAGTSILDLTESNPTHAGFHYSAERILQPFTDPRSLVYDPLPAGSERARAEVADYYAERGSCVAPDRILLTTSTSESYGYLLKLLADPGDEILVPRPSYPLFEFLATLESVRIRQYPLVYHGGWSIDFDALSTVTTERTRAVIIVNPNNPTGSFIKKLELERLVALCEQRSLALISDEVFSDYGWASDSNRMESLVDVRRVLTFSLSGLSKIAGLPQMKLGWIVTGGPDDLRVQAMERLELIADTYLSVGTPVQHALPGLIGAGREIQTEISARVRENFSWLASVLGSESPFRILRVEGGWYAVMQVPRTRTEEEWCLDLLDRDSVLVQPGFFYDFDSEAFLVLSLLTEPAVFHPGCERLLARAIQV